MLSFVIPHCCLLFADNRMLGGQGPGVQRHETVTTGDKAFFLLLQWYCKS